MALDVFHFIGKHPRMTGKHAVFFFGFQFNADVLGQGTHSEWDFKKDSKGEEINPSHQNQKQSNTDQTIRFEGERG